MADKLFTFFFAMVLVVVACASSPKLRNRPLPIPDDASIRRVPCMELPPTMPVVEWPTPDKMGNFIMHESTARVIREALYQRDAYIARNYRLCYQAVRR